MNNKSFVLNSILLLCGVMVGLLLAIVIQGRPVQVVQQASPEQIVTPVQIGNPNFELPDGAELALSLNSIFKDVAKKAVPAVVSVTADIHQENRFGRKRYRRNLDDRHLPVESAGSGVIISKKGYVVTNNHVVENGKDIEVTLSNNYTLSATKIGADPNTDIAVLKIDPTKTDLQSIDLGDSENLEVGDWVIAVGNPFRLASTVTTGIISALSRPMDIFESSQGVKDFIQTDAAINPGNSGGALLNLSGQLIGINTAIATETGVYQGAGFAVPVNLVSHVVNEIIAHGHVRRGYMGIQMAKLEPHHPQVKNNPGLMGARITSLYEDSPAMQAGLEINDVIVGIDDHEILSTNQVASRIALKSPGQSIKVSVLRGDEYLDLYVTLESADSPAMSRWFEENRPALPELPDDSIINLEEWGFGLSRLDPDDVKDFGVMAGAYIAFIEGGSQAALDAIPRDVVILSIDSHPVSGPEDVVRILEEAFQLEAEELLFEVRKREGWNAYYDVTVPSLN